MRLGVRVSLTPPFADVAQLARETAFQAVCRGFESRRLLHAGVAQTAERLPRKQRVAGSMPAASPITTERSIP